MLSSISKTAQSVVPLLLRAGVTRFYSTSPFNHVKDKIYEFNQDKTREALLQVHDYGLLDPVIDLKNLLILDTISETPSSITDRAFDHNHKKFLAVKTLKLETTREWNQVNLALRQYCFHKPELGKVLAMDYNEGNQEVKIITEIGKTTAGDYSYFRVKNERPWTNYEIRLLYLNLVNQINRLRAFGGICESIRPKNLFYDTTRNIFKLYDFSDFDTIKGHGGWNLDDKVPINIDSAMYSLVQIINPYAPVHNSEEAQAYLRTNHSDFLNEIEPLQTQIRKWQFQPSEVNRSIIGSELKHSKTQWFSEYDYEQFFFDKMENVWEEKGLSKNSEEWASLNQGLGNYIEAINTLQRHLNKTLESYGENHQNTSKVYAELAGVYKAADNFEKASKYFEKALNTGESSSNMDKIIMGQIYNSYGKFLLDQKQYAQAVDFFTKAEANLLNAPGESKFLAAEIQTNKYHALAMQENPNQDAKTDTWSSSNSNNECNRKSGFSKLFKILSFIVFVKVACLVLKKTQELLDYIPDFNPKETDQPSQPNQTEATTQQKDQPSIKPKPSTAELKLQALKTEDDATSGSQGATIKESLLFGAILLISALGLTL